MERRNWQSEFEALDLETRIRKLQELWDSIASDPDAVWLTPSQRNDLKRRLAEYRADPDQVSTWDAARGRMLSQSWPQP